MKKSFAKKKIRIYFELFFTFLKIGAISFGGGYAMLTIIEREFVEKKKWATREELLNIFAIGESTPGAIAINVASFLGTKYAGFFGGLFATIGVALPAFFIILALSYIIDLVKGNIWVARAFMGVRVGVVVLIAQAVLKFAKTLEKDWYSIPIVIISFCIAIFTKISIIYVLLGIAGFMIVYVAIRNEFRRNKEKDEKEKTKELYQYIENTNCVVVQKKKSTIAVDFDKQTGFEKFKQNAKSKLSVVLKKQNKSNISNNNANQEQPNKSNMMEDSLDYKSVNRSLNIIETYSDCKVDQNNFSNDSDYNEKNKTNGNISYKNVPINIDSLKDNENKVGNLKVGDTSLNNELLDNQIEQLSKKINYNIDKEKRKDISENLIDQKDNHFKYYCNKERLDKFLIEQKNNGFQNFKNKFKLKNRKGGQL